MSGGLFDASIPVFLRYLDRLLALVDAAEAHAHAHQIDDSELLNARLAADMLPFATQVNIAANFALRAAFPLAGHVVPPYGEFPATFLQHGIGLADITQDGQHRRPAAHGAVAWRD